MTPEATPAARGTVPRLRITEIFLSLQGESRPVGLPTVFVRLTGCPLRCGYCDTEYAFHGGTQTTLEDIVAEVVAYGVAEVCVTGGEPLAQPNCRPLLAMLCEQGLSVSLETSGALSLGGVDSRVAVVMDIKTPGSGEVARNDWRNLEHLKPSDQLKFVLVDRADYDWSVAAVREHDLAGRFAVLFSPAWNALPERQLAEWMLADRLPVRFQIQLHKHLWGDEPGH